MEVKSWDRNYYEKIDWKEVPMWKALKIWANNQKHIKCIDGNLYYFYHGQEALSKITHNQIQFGKWFVEKM
ncbi:hypothetical protein [Heyndrickxia camelliae]|uniref:Uncharacterized protein n=1 Tax=Heyndrickxia camelliae TaxID=1707093 RepID=A0A2N3LFC7_9BACI|nr:hypothetical protein [Heyndrickxia camelliae]PKR83244.1 hypothetical protein CWO92_19770 [Heyndrickxia camelliae]